MPNKIFVDSLRDDQQAYAVRIRARLANVLGASNDFMDGEQPARRPALPPSARERPSLVSAAAILFTSPMKS